MKAVALVADSKRNFTLQDVWLDEPNADQLVIRAHFSGVSVGTEFALIREKISWGPFPLCTGYMATGIVEAVGANVEGFAVGDRVYYRTNDAMRLSDGTRVSCVTGTHCSHVVTRPFTTHGVERLPPDAPMEAASMFVIPAVGLHGVDLANPRLGDTVVVHGVGPIGLGVVAACAHRGCRVIAVDIHEKRLEIARFLGADFMIDGRENSVAERVEALAPDGADVVFECSGVPECLDPAIALCREGGAFVWQGNYGLAPVSIRFMVPHARRLRMVFPSDDGGPAGRRAIVKNIASGALPWERCISHRIPWTETPDLFRRLEADDVRDIIGIVVDWRT